MDIVTITCCAATIVISQAIRLGYRDQFRPRVPELALRIGRVCVGPLRAVVLVTSGYFAVRVVKTPLVYRLQTRRVLQQPGPGSVLVSGSVSHWRFHQSKAVGSSPLLKHSPTCSVSSSPLSDSSFASWLPRIVRQSSAHVQALHP